MKRPKILLPILAFVLLLTAGWFALYAQRMPIVDSPYAEDGVIDLTGLDLNNSLVDLRWNWEFYPGAILYPEDFARGDTPTPTFRSDIPDAYTITTGTHRVSLKLPPGQTYALCGWSIDYGTRAFVNSELAVEVGHVSGNASEAVPRVNYMTLPIVAKDGMTEIILQYSNFHHNEGGSLTLMYVASSELVERYKTVTALPVFLLSGGLLLLFAYYLLDFFLRRKSEILFFALLCLLFALRDHRFYFSQLMPWDYDWPTQYKLLFVRFVLVVPLCWLMVSGMYRGLFDKWVSRIFITLCGVICVLAMSLPTTEIIAFHDFFERAVFPFVVYFVLCLVLRHIKVRGGTAIDWIITFGFFVLLTTFLYEANWQRVLPAVTRGGVTPAGMLVFVFCMMTALGIRAGEDAAELARAQRQADYLTQLEKTRAEFLANISHEIRTPLTVMSGYAQRALRQITAGTVNEDTRQGLLTVSLEAQRLSMLAQQLLDTTMEPADAEPPRPVEPMRILERALLLCQPILEKNRNQLRTHVLEECPPVLANEGMVLQALVNLCVNANRHTKDGVIAISVKRAGSMAMFEVTDNGEGVAPELLSRAFERGVSGDGESGLGLAICKEVVEYHGGEIELISRHGNGTRVTFTLPLAKTEKEA